MSFRKQQYGEVHSMKRPRGGKFGATEQKGFVLVLALIILSVLTLIGVSSMNTANMELRATANSIHHHIAFNATQAVLEYVVSEPAEVSTPPLPGQINWQTTQAVAQTPDLSGVPVLNLPRTSTLVASVSYVGCSSGLGSSLQAGKGLSNNFFAVAASAKNASGTATSLQSMGVRYLAASCPQINPI